MAIAKGTKSDGCSAVSAARSTKTDRSQCCLRSLAALRSVSMHRHTTAMLASETTPRATTAMAVASTYAETLGGVAEYDLPFLMVGSRSLVFLPLYPEFGLVAAGLGLVTGAFTAPCRLDIYSPLPVCAPAISGQGRFFLLSFPAT